MRPAWMWTRMFLFAWSMGCGNVRSSNDVDAALDVDAAVGVDAAVDVPEVPSGRCDRAKPFGAPVLVPGISSPGNPAAEAGASLTADELTMYFASNRLNPGSPNFDVYVASRSSITDSFGVAQRIDALDLGGDERKTWISPDELSIYIYSSPQGNYDLFISSRTNKVLPFGTPQPLGVNTAEIEEGAATTADGGTLYFHRGAGSIVLRSVLGPAGFDTASPVAELNTPDAGNPVPRGDDLGIYFASSRGGSLGSADIYFASRLTTTSAFNQITNVTELNSSSFDIPNWISSDGCRIYFTSGRDSSSDIWIASRPL